MDTSLEIEHKVLAYLKSTPDYSPRPFVLRMSLVGECPRLLSYMAAHGTVQEGPFELNASAIHRMARGTWCHDMWQTLLQKVYDNDEFTCVEEELRFRLPCGYEMVGHNDGYFRSIDAIYELKTVADNTFDMIVNMDSPLPQNYEQATFYAGVKGASNILLHYYNTASGASLFFKVPFNQWLFDSLVTKMNDLAINILNKNTEIPARPYYDPTCSPCWYCAMNKTCYQGWVSEVKDMTTLELPYIEEPEQVKIRSYMELCVAHRKARLEYSKSEEEAKTLLANEVLSRGKNRVLDKTMAAEVKLGTKGNPLVTIKEF